jgi:CyaY protein
MMDESAYQRLADAVFRRIDRALEDVDPSDVDVDFAGDVMTLTLKNGVRCIINTQRPARQMWVAAKANAWHFSWDDKSQRWLDDKNADNELFGTLQRIVKEHAGIDVPF